MNYGGGVVDFRFGICFVFVNDDLIKSGWLEIIVLVGNVMLK